MACWYVAEVAASRTSSRSGAPHIGRGSVDNDWGNGYDGSTGSCKSKGAAIHGIRGEMTPSWRLDHRLRNVDDVPRRIHSQSLGVCTECEVENPYIPMSIWDTNRVPSSTKSALVGSEFIASLKCVMADSEYWSADGWWGFSV